jgi:hypothetical protein
MPHFKLKEYGNTNIMLVRTNETGLSGGIPPETSQVIRMKKEELDYLIIILEEYRANKR